MFSTILLILLLTAVIEFFSIVLRLVYHLIGAQVQKRIHLPRIHHSYAGLFLLFIYWAAVNSPSFAVLASRWTIIIGIALIASDLLHHLLFLPLIRKYKYDLHMAKHREMHRSLSKALGVVLIIIGLLALLTPFTPGSWLAILGAVMLFGRDRTRRMLRSVLGKRLYETLKIDRFLREKNE